MSETLSSDADIAQPGWEPTNIQRSALAANIFLVGFAAAVLYQVFLWPVADETFVQTAAVARMGLLPPALVFVAGLVVIWELPERAWVRAITISAVLLLAEPIVTLVWQIGNDLPSELVIKVASYKLGSARSLLAIAALLTVRYRRRNVGTAHLAVGAIVAAAFFDAFHQLGLEAAIGDGSRTVSGLGLLAPVLATFGPTSLLFALVLVFVADPSDAMLEMLRRVGIAIAVAAVLAYPLGRWQLVDDSRFSAEAWLLANIVSWISNSLVVAAILVAASLLYRSSGRSPGTSAAPGMGSMVAAAVVFWPLGLVAISHAANAMAASAQGDRSVSEGRRKAELFRNWAFGVGALLTVVSVLASA